MVTKARKQKSRKNELSQEKVKYRRKKSWIVRRTWCDYNFQTACKYRWNFTQKRVWVWVWQCECGCHNGLPYIHTHPLINIHPLPLAILSILIPTHLHHHTYNPVLHIVFPDSIIRGLLFWDIFFKISFFSGSVFRDLDSNSLKLVLDQNL